MRRRFIAIVLSLGLSLLAVGSAIPANAQTALTVDVTSATLIAKGAAVDVDLTVTCEPGLTGGAFVQVTQRSANTVMQGSGIASPRFACTGQPQIVTVRVIADAGGAPFKVGDAVVQTTVGACDEFGICESIETTDIIRVRR
jgi:hypothetical protein